MKNFKPVYKELENLIINKLPEYIEKINKEHNDGIILKPFENKSLEENCIKNLLSLLNLKKQNTKKKTGLLKIQFIQIE
nr:hypothetical protein [uncultured Treponema sp.]